ncbi:hypothetical protein sos41_03950 [Alphaproteobacteria bacterium SO-S41]|nr:hypothetical protein sos41_03950 [Alphaproteobacteria bacterium SO-S41]
MTFSGMIGRAALLLLGLAPTAWANIVTLTEGIENKHPAAYYKAAAQMFADGDRDEAVFWFYAGQLRYRVHLSCHPDLKPDGDPALFGALSESVGRPINEYAFGDPPALAATIDKVLAWDDATPNGYTPKTDCADAITTTREGLAGLRDEVLASQDEIRREREKNGLPNR